MAQRPTPFIGAVRTPWLRSVAQAARVLAVLIGGVAAALDGADPLDGALALLLVAFIVWRAFPRSLELARIRDVVALELLLNATAVGVTGGWVSPWLASFVVALGLAALGLTLVRAAALAVGAVVIVSLATLGADVGGVEVVTRLSTLLLVVLFGALTRRAMVQAGGHPDESLGRLETLWAVRGLLEGLHGSVARTPASFSVEEAVLTLRRSSAVMARVDVLAVLAADPNGEARVVGAVGIADHADTAAGLPARVTVPARDATITTLPLHGAGFRSTSDHGVYAWLPVDSDTVPHLVVIETTDTDVLVDDVIPELQRLLQPLAVTVANAAWFGRVRTLSVDEERQRIAARLHDQFAQSLAVVSLELDLALRRHPDDEGLVELRGHVRESLGELRDTMVELRASVDEEHSLGEVLTSLLDRVARRHDVATDVSSEGDGPRPPIAIEQQLLRVAQDLVRRAVVERGATAIRIEHRRTAEGTVLEIADDGHPPPAALRVPLTDVITDRVQAIGASATMFATEAGLGAVRVVVTGSGGDEGRGLVV